VLNNGDRLREIGYHDLERAEDEEALLGRATEVGGLRDRPIASRQGTDRAGSGARERQQESPRDRTRHLTERELRERWPIG
jgi:hypothetical protein